MCTLLLTNTTWHSPAHAPTSTRPDAPRAFDRGRALDRERAALGVTFTEPASPRTSIAPDAVLIVRSLPAGQ